MPEMRAWRVTNKTRNSCRYMRAGKSRKSAMRVLFSMFIGVVPFWEHGHSYAFSRVPDLDGYLRSGTANDAGVNISIAKEQGVIVPTDDADYCFCSRAAANRWVERKMGVK